jgi:hypothetical protein
VAPPAAADGGGRPPRPGGGPHLVAFRPGGPAVGEPPWPGALLSGGGHGLAFLHAQDELNDIAPTERRGEVTAAFICVIYLVVGGSVIATGLLDLEVSLSVAVGIVAVALAAGALATAAWQTRRAI